MVGQLGGVERLLEVGQARVRAAEDRDLLERDAEGSNPLDDVPAFVLAVHELRLRAVRERRAQRLLGAAEPRHESVRQREHLRGRAVVLLEAHDERLRIAPRHREQVLGRGTREGIDRLVVVADDAELVAAAEPAFEQLLLEQVDVLVLVDREREIAVAELACRVGALVEEPDGPLEQVLEVDRAGGRLALLVLAVDARHQVGWDRRLGRVIQVVGGADAPVLRPFDLGGEVAGRPEAVRAGQAVRDLPQEERLGGEDLARRTALEIGQLREGRGVEGPRLDTRGAEGREARAELARGLVRERDREDLGGLERARRDLVRDPPRDRCRLARAGAGEDADRAGHLLRGTALLGIEPVEDHASKPTGPGRTPLRKIVLANEPRSLRRPTL